MIVNDKGPSAGTCHRIPVPGCDLGASGLPLALFAMLSGGFEMRSTAVMPVIASALMVFGGWVLVLLIAGIVLIRKVIERDRLAEGLHGGWLESFLDNPARLLMGSFLFIGVVGAFVLCQPWCSATGVALRPVDALFTSISAVCVTGLVVQDTPGFFSGMGQGVILGLIQIGGLGIMTLTTLAMHLLGQRLSLRQERVMGSLAHAGHSDLIVSLATVFRFTLWAELVGSAGLFFLFLKLGDSLPDALWRGVFTSISAFCNAGFALQTDSLVGYAHEPLVLHMVGFLIMAGGLAPATCLMIPHWIGGKRIPIAAKLALITTAAFLILGWIGILVFEWDGVLSDFGFVDKLHHAWFQSVTLRTAGFNSVDIAPISHPTYLLMLIFMFVGGSPGGTAGGIKTTTVAVLAVAFWTDIMHRSEIVVHNRRITPRTVYRAITIVMSGILLWMSVVFFLEVTQSISARDLVFEATSALGTVGLSTGATGQLDDIGKLTIVFAMFAGRVGPMTLFLLLSRQRVDTVPSCPDARIPLS